jgi:hypothetical protein
MLAKKVTTRERMAGRRFHGARRSGSPQQLHHEQRLEVSLSTFRRYVRNQVRMVPLEDVTT